MCFYDVEEVEDLPYKRVLKRTWQCLEGRIENLENLVKQTA